MQVKGSAVESIVKFVHNKYNGKYNDWVNSLNEDSRQIINEKVLTSGWYPIETAMIEPTRKICEMFYAGDVKGAWEIGRYAADIALTGIFKLLVKVGNPKFMILRAGGIISSYYKPGDVKVVELRQNAIAVYLSNFPQSNPFIENRIAGWIERALEINGCSNVQIKVTQSSTRGSEVIEIVAAWQ
jgi:hypothetical protein